MAIMCINLCVLEEEGGKASCPQPLCCPDKHEPAERQEGAQR